MNLDRKIYCHPKIDRSGLGNCMLVWARAFIFARENGFDLLAPEWFQFRLGPLIRREPVKRFYASEFTNRGYIVGWRKRLILRRAQRINEVEFEAIHATTAGNGSLVIEFEGLKDYFTTLIPHRESLRSELERIANPRALLGAQRIEPPIVAAHIRRGDQTRQRKIPLNKILQYTPIEWFVAAIKALRAKSDCESIPVNVFSDGSREELEDVLKLPNCKLVTTGKAIGDIFLMSRARLLLASGYSTFSMWASFLGRMPTLYYPGKLQQKLFPEEIETFEGEWEIGDPLPETIISRNSFHAE
jgi:hypothetical protein